MLHKTQGIVLRSIRYGETSVIVSIFTELFGLQSYLVNGVRTSKTRSLRANLLQPANILDLVVYHQVHKNLQRISDFRLAYIYQGLYSNVVKNTIALYLSELLCKSLSEPEAHPDLFYFVSNSLQWMDQQDSGLANFPLYLTLHVGELLGFGFYGQYQEHSPYFDLQEGTFVNERPPTSWFLEKQEAKLTSALLHISSPDQLINIKISKSERNRLLSAYLDYLRLHLPDFSEMKSPAILREVLG